MYFFINFYYFIYLIHLSDLFIYSYVIKNTFM